MKRLTIAVLAVLAACLCLPAAVRCQETEIFRSVSINSSPNPVGSGARAMGMGGAFIAVADDATAASWNPGGLMQLERPEFSFAFTFDHRRKDFDSSTHPEASGMNELYREDLNYFSVAYPFRAFNKNMIISLNYQRLYDFYDEIEYDQDLRSISSSASHSPLGVSRATSFLDLDSHVTFSQHGSLKAFAPAYAIQVTPRLSLGVTFNFWTDNLGYDNRWKSVRTAKAGFSAHSLFSGPFGRQTNLSRGSADLYFSEENDNFEGFNMNVGLLWDINRYLTLGAVIKTPFTADVDRTTYVCSTTIMPGQSAIRPAPLEEKESIRMRFPLSYGIGLAVRFSDEFTVACDVYRTNWSDFWVESGGKKTSPITGDRRSNSHIHDTTQVRLGCEYLWILEKTIVPLRMGAFYDPEPSRKNPDDYFGVTLGTGVMIRDVVLDCAYIYRWGRNVKGDVLEVQGTDADVDQHILYVSMIYHF